VQSSAPRKTHEEEQQAHDEEQCADIIEFFHERGDAGVLVLFGEGGRLVEEEPREGGGGIEPNEEVEDAVNVS
jgi:hypothetical protein